MAVEKVGIDIRVTGAQDAIKKLGAVGDANKALGKQTEQSAAFMDRMTRASKDRAKQASKSAKATEGGTAALKAFNAKAIAATVIVGTLAATFFVLYKAVSRFVKILRGVTTAIFKIFTNVIKLVAKLVTNAASAIVKITKAIVKFGISVVELGKFGAEVEFVGQTFGNATAGIIDSTDALEMLRKQTRGVIGDFDLMRLSVRFLAGTTPELRQELLKVVDGELQLGKAIDTITRSAKALGIEQNVALEKASIAFRTMEKRRLDDFGITINAIEANRAYAKSLGKTTSELTQVEKQVAFATKALSEMNRVLEQLPISTTLEHFQRVNATLSNMKTKLAIAFEPVAATVGKAMDMLVSKFNEFAKLVFPVIRAFTELGSAAANLWMDKFGNGVNPTLEHTQKVLTYVAAALILFAEQLMAPIAAAQRLQNAFELVNTATSKMAQSVFKSNLPGAMHDQLDRTDKVFIRDAEVLAFNVGKGAANLVFSFVAGLKRGETAVVEAVTSIAQIVADFLTGFSPAKRGPLSLIDVGASNLAEAWVKGFLGGITGSFDEVLSYVDIRLGDIGSFSRAQVEGRLMQLDVAIQPFKDSLEIVKADMEAIAGFVDPAIKVLDRQRKMVLDLFQQGKNAGIDHLRLLDRQIERMRRIGELEEDQVDRSQIQLGLAQSEQAQERALLAIQMRRLGEPGKEVTTKAAKATKAKAGGGGAAKAGVVAAGGGLPAAGVSPDLNFSPEIEAAMDDLRRLGNSVAAEGQRGIEAGRAEADLGGANREGAEAKFELHRQKSRIKRADPMGDLADSITDSIKDKFTPDWAANLFKGADGFIADALRNLSGAEGKTGQAASSVGVSIGNQLFMGAVSILASDKGPTVLFGAAVATAITDLSDPASPASVALDVFSANIEDGFNDIFGAEGFIRKEGGIFDLFKNAVQGMMDAVVGIFNLLTSNEEGSLGAALSTMGAFLTKAIVEPAYNAMNAMIDAVEWAINQVITGLLSAPYIGDALAELGVKAIDIKPIAAGAKGGLGMSGTFLAGEKGPELISTRDPATVFPNAATQALMSIAAGTQSMQSGRAGGGGGGSTNNNMSMSNTFNVGSSQQAMLIERQQLALLRR